MMLKKHGILQIKNKGIKMTEKEILQMMRDAGLVKTKYAPSFQKLVEIAYKTGRAEENEACAKLVDEMQNTTRKGVINAIRARREQ